jgi:hypothetical protein
MAASIEPAAISPSSAGSAPRSTRRFDGLSLTFTTPSQKTKGGTSFRPFENR